MKAGDLLQVLATLGTALSAYAAFRAASATRRAAEDSFLEQHQNATVQSVQSNRERARQLRLEIGSIRGRLPTDRDGDTTFHLLLNLIELWEHQAAGVNDGVLDVEVFNKMTGGLLLNVYRDYSTWIRSVRRDDPQIYDQLEALVDKLIVMRSSGYVINRRVIRNFRHDGLTPFEISRLKSLIRENEYSYYELQGSLIEAGMEQEKNRITRLSRQRLGWVRPYEASHEQQTVEMFARVQESTSGMYPPRDLLQAVYGRGQDGIRNWLSRGGNTSRFVFVVDDTEKVIGHVEIQSLAGDLSAEQERYWHSAFGVHASFNAEQLRERNMTISDLAVIKRLGVDPAWQNRDVGRQLLRRAIHEIEHNLRKVPALVVIDALSEARALYDSEGGRVVGSFNEPTGEHLLSYIF